MKAITILATLLATSIASANTLLQDQMNLHTAQVESLFYTYYAPAEFKRKHLGWNFKRSLNELKGSVASGELQTSKDYHRALRKFFNSTDDHHVSVQFLATEEATLPITLKTADDKVFIAFIDRSKLSEEQFPFAVGDEVVTFGGIPAFEQVMNISKVVADKGTQTNIALATLNMTRRRASRGLEVPQGEVALQVRAKQTGQLQGVQLAWAYTQESIALQVDNPNPLDDEVLNPLQLLLASTGLGDNIMPISLGSKLDMSLIERFMQASHMMPEVSLAAPSSESVANPHEMGGSVSFVPQLGESIDKMNTGFFRGYTFKLEDKTVGVIRIPSYSAGAQQSAEFAQKVAMLQANTDALIIDQVNNPGGSVPFLYSLVSLLATQDMPVPRHKIALTQEEVVPAQNNVALLKQVQTDEQAVQLIGPNIGGYPVDLSVAKALETMFATQVSEWAAGNRLTKPVPISGVDVIKPNANAYTKPILILVNELDFSGGDFFPAIMQDNKRATVLGVKTAGAGGFVLNTTFPNLLGVARMNFTGSLAERLDKSPIENLGVTPDIQYALTASDLQDGYQDYKKQILSAVSGLLSL